MAIVAQIRDHYDSLAFMYRAFWGDHLHHGLFNDSESPADAQLKMLDYCIQSLDLKGNEKVLDAGCGYGGTLLYLAQNLGCGGVGITLSPKQAQIAREKARAAGFSQLLEFVVADADSYTFPCCSFDLVWAMESSEHFADKARFLKNARSALRADGRLLLAAWTGDMANQRVLEVARAFLCPELWTANQYIAATEAAGFRVIHCRDLTEKVVHTWEICRQRANAARLAVALLPRAAREFVAGIDIILDAYRSGDLTYTVLSGRAKR